MNSDTTTPTPDETERTPEEAAIEFAKALLEQARPNRAERRKQARDARRAHGANMRHQAEADQAYIMDKRRKLRRTHGNPAARNDALVAWIEAEDDKRTATIVYGEVE